jgi:hypothetical protein
VEFAPLLMYLDLASNFFWGPRPVLQPTVTADFRFNYFDNCDQLCCYVNSDCTEQCAPIEPIRDDLPLGIEESVWTELNVSVLGEKKRIIQIETRFQSTPHYLKSYACPSDIGLTPCDDTRIILNATETSEVIRLENGVPFRSSQNSNTNQTFAYLIQGGVCNTSVKV